MHLGRFSLFSLKRPSTRCACAHTCVCKCVFVILILIVSLSMKAEIEVESVKKKKISGLKVQIMFTLKSVILPWLNFNVQFDLRGSINSS